MSDSDDIGIRLKARYTSGKSGDVQAAIAASSLARIAHHLHLNARFSETDGQFAGIAFLLRFPTPRGARPISKDAAMPVQMKDFTVQGLPRGTQPLSDHPGRVYDEGGYRYVESPLYLLRFDRPGRVPIGVQLRIAANEAIDGQGVTMTFLGDHMTLENDAKHLELGLDNGIRFWTPEVTQPPFAGQEPTRTISWPGASPS